MTLRRLTLMSLVVGLTCNVCSALSDPLAELEHIEVLAGLADPSMIAFSPDGRMFITERVEGRLRIARYNTGTDQWELINQPFFTFDVPKNGGVPESYQSSGLRGIAFDPDFEENGFIYCFYMKNQPRHNRVVRIKASAANPDVADPGETLLLELPFAGGQSSGSHNGGALAFGPDGMLYVTTGDGWAGGDDVQSLTTWTGKVLRIHADGTIPTDNPFYGQTSGMYRAIYALGLRNPFSFGIDSLSVDLFINDVGGVNKASIYALTAGANFGHDGYGGIGAETAPWGNGSMTGQTSNVMTGGVWIPDCGPLPDAVRGRYIASLWGSNASSAGSLTIVEATGGNATETLLANVGVSDPQGDLKPVALTLGPDGWLYYIATSYKAQSGRVFVIRRDGPPSADINRDGAVNVHDLLVVLSAWGPCQSGEDCPADVIGDCHVGVNDLLFVLSMWSS